MSADQSPLASAFSPVAVVGCGLIGAGWAALFMAAGLEVRPFDPVPERLADLTERCTRLQAAIAELQPIRSGQLVITRSLEEAVGQARLVQENAPERLATKRSLISEIEAATDVSTIIASSTSALLWSALSEGMCHPERLILAHPFNPVHLIPLVELFTPEPELLERAHRFYTSVGKRPVRLAKESEGHVAGRLAAALWREAVHLAANGVATVAEIDKALVDGPGLRWAVQGAHQTYHTGGGPGGLADYLTHLGPSQEHRWTTLGTPSLDASTCQLLIDGVAAETEGQSIAELEAARDAKLIAILRARHAGRQRS